MRGVEISALSHETIPTSPMTITLVPGDMMCERAWELEPGPVGCG